MNGQNAVFEDYVNLRVNEIAYENDYYFSADICFDWASDLSIERQIAVFQSKALHDVRKIVENISFENENILYSQGLERKIEESVLNKLEEIAQEKGINIIDLMKTILLRGKHYLILKNLRGIPEGEMNEFQRMVISKGDFSRFDLDHWMIYAYLGYLFINRRLS